MIIRLDAVLAFAMLTMAVAVTAETYRPPVERETDAPPNAWFVKRSAPTAWCAYRTLAAAKLAVESEVAKEDYEPGETASVRYRGNLIERAFVTNESEDAIADDTYYLDNQQRVSKMVRTGHYIRDPMFSVTFVPGAHGKLILSRASETAVRRMNEAGYEPYIVEWPTYFAFSDMPFHALVQRMPNVSIRWGCGG